MGFVDVLTSVGLTRRRERRQLLGAARLLMREMDRAAGSIRFALAENSWGSLDWEALRLTSWPDASPELAQNLRSEEWSIVEKAAKTSDDLLAMQGVDRRIFPHAAGGPAQADRYELLSAATELEDAVLALERASGWSEPADGIRLTRELMADSQEPYVVGSHDAVH
jgi:hypothetical protein